MSEQPKRCGSCRFWGNPDEAGQFRQCLAVADDGGNRAGSTPDADQYGNPYEDEAEREEYRRWRAENLAVVHGDYVASLQTRADFGCVLHQERS